ncbi:kinase-like domain-containing protein [Cyathus striatus]|nr:kinase-like domain-containing protein [Cyathus striatus]
MTPVLSPSLSSSSSSLVTPTTPTLTRPLSTSSVHSIAELLVSAAASSSSIRLPEGNVEVVKEDGLRHSKVRLSARQYKTPLFAHDLLGCLRTLQVLSWSAPQIHPQDIVIYKVSGSLTNAVFFVSCPAVSGPRVFGTFENGRVEEYFDSTTLTANDIRDPEISRWIGARMAELHSVDIDVIEGLSPETSGEGNGWDIAARQNIKSWMASAREVLDLPAIPEEIRAEFDLQRFEKEWHRYLQWLSKVDDTDSGSRRVFAHNDTQYGNLLRLTHPAEGIEPHRQIIVVDFEYASPNPASFDIANHFHEWTANYHGPEPHTLDPSVYPTEQERYNFYKAYIQHSNIFGKNLPNSDSELQRRSAQLDEQVRVWSPASHAMWAVWGIVQAREDIEGQVATPEFDYIGYARGRMSAFRRELQRLTIL